MKKTIKIIFITLILSLSFFATTNWSDENLNIWSVNGPWNADNNSALDGIKGWGFIGISWWWEKAAYNLIVTIARDLKNLFFIISTIFFFLIIVKLIFTQNTEEESEKFKKWLIWISLWIVVMQISYSFVLILFDNWVWQGVAFNFINNIVNPFIEILSMAASFFFIAMAIYAFYKLVTANWNEEKATAGKNTIIYAIIWFVIIRFSKEIVEATYWKLWGSCSLISSNCLSIWDLEWFAKIIADIINRINWFVAIIVIIMIIYAWMNILLWWWDEEKLKKAKSSILYIAIGILILVINYLILTFFIFPESTI